MTREPKPGLETRVELWSKYIGLVSAVVSVLTSLLGNPVVAYASLAVLGVVVVEYCLRVIFQKSPMQRAYQVWLPASVAQRGDLVYHYPPEQRRKAILWLAGFTFLFLSVGGLNLWKAIKPPVPRAEENEKLILIVKFQPRDETKRKIDFPELITGKIQNLEETDEIRVEQIYDVVVDSEDAAFKLGKATNATLVIWGNFDDTFVYPKYKITNKDGIKTATLGAFLLSEEEAEFDGTVRVEIPSVMEYLANFTIGQVHYLAGEYGDALRYFHNAENTLEVILEKSSELELDLKNSLDLKEENLYYYLGNIYAIQGSRFMSLKYYERAIEKKPIFAEAYNNLGAILFGRGDEIEALSKFDRAIDLNYKLTHAYYNRGIIFYRQGDFDAAVSDFNKAIGFEPHPLFYQVRADAYRCSLSFELAKEDLTTAIELMRENPEFAGEDNEAEARALNNRGVAEKELGEYENALKDFERALAIKPDFAVAVYNKAATNGMMGKGDAAIAGLREAIQLNDDLESKAACDPDFDGVRNHPQMPPLSTPPGGCDVDACPN